MADAFLLVLLVMVAFLAGTYVEANSHRVAGWLDDQAERLRLVAPDRATDTLPDAVTPLAPVAARLVDWEKEGWG